VHTFRRHGRRSTRGMMDDYMQRHCTTHENDNRGPERQAQNILTSNDDARLCHSQFVTDQPCLNCDLL
jgi:hypothetical protein